MTAALGGRPTVVILATGARPAWDLALAAADNGAVDVKVIVTSSA